MRSPLITVLVLAFALAVATGASARPTHLVAHPKNRTLAARLTAQEANLAHARYVCRYGRGPGRRWSCKAQWWLARELGETQLAVEAKQWLLADRDWLLAVHYAGKAFPHTQPWLLSCSRARSEGGWGRFVWNGGSVVDEHDRVRARDRLIEIYERGSGAGGWLQFMRGTFDRNVDRAFGEAWRAGVHVPARYHSFFSRVGQAITGASMYIHGQSGEWSGSGC